MNKFEKIKFRYLIYLFLIVILTHNEFIDFLKNKRILTYEIHINLDKMINKVTTQRFELLSIYSKNFTMKSHDISAEELVIGDKSLRIFDCAFDGKQQMSKIRNYFMENFEYDYNNFVKGKKILSDNFNNSVIINFFIAQETNLIKNFIFIKTFDPNLVNEFIVFFINKVNMKIYQNACLLNDKELIMFIKKDFIDKVFNQIEILKKKNINYNKALNANLSKNEKINFFSTEALAKICKFLDNQLNQISSNYSERQSFVNAYNEIKKLVDSSILNEKNIEFIKISNKSDKRLFDVYRFMSSIVLCLFIILISETIYKKLIYK